MPQPAAIESGDRSHALQPVESVAQISVILQDTDPTLDPALAASARTAAGEGVVLLLFVAFLLTRRVRLMTTIAQNHAP